MKLKAKRLPKYLQTGAETISLTLADERALHTLSEYTMLPSWESQGTVNRLLNRGLIKQSNYVVLDNTRCFDLTDLGRRILVNVRRKPRG